jgi:hypothetical protein
LECFKVIETHLYKKLFEKDIRVSKHKTLDLINYSLKHKIITQEDLPAINDIRGMRNSAAHTDTKFTKDNAHFAIEYVKKIIKTND